ncbi:MAG: hypothetical protein AAGK78_10200, partial [Planctomycetota bacterium]
MSHPADELLRAHDRAAADLWPIDRGSNNLFAIDLPTGPAMLKVYRTDRATHIGDADDRMEREIAALSTYRGPHVPAILDADKMRLVLLTEHVAGDP